MANVYSVYPIPEVPAASIAVYAAVRDDEGRVVTSQERIAWDVRPGPGFAHAKGGEAGSFPQLFVFRQRNDADPGLKGACTINASLDKNPASGLRVPCETVAVPVAVTVPPVGKAVLRLAKYDALEALQRGLLCEHGSVNERMPGGFEIATYSGYPANRFMIGAARSIAPPQPFNLGIDTRWVGPGLDAVPGKAGDRDGWEREVIAEFYRLLLDESASSKLMAIAEDEEIAKALLPIAERLV